MSEKLYHDGTDWMGAKVCPICGKTFSVPQPSEWVFKRYKRGKTMTYYCSWKCIRRMEREKKNETKSRD